MSRFLSHRHHKQPLGCVTGSEEPTIDKRSHNLRLTKKDRLQKLKAMRESQKVPQVNQQT
jgi:hypothetical protein